MAQQNRRDVDQMGILSFVFEKKVWTFVGGVAAGLILPPLVKSKTVRKAAVAVTAKGMSLKDDAKAACESIKEDAQDVYAEARQRAAEGDGPAVAEEKA